MDNIHILRKIILFVLYNVLTESASRRGYLLCRCIRLYLELDMYISFDVHTEETIQAGESLLHRFSELLKVRSYEHWKFALLTKICSEIC